MSRRRRWGTVLAASLAALTAIVGSVALRPLSYADAWLRISLWRAGVRGHYAEVNGLRIHYFEAAANGDGPGTPLLLVHGLGARGEDWGELIPGLAAAGFHVYAPDLPGYGRSEQPDISYTIAYEAAAMEDFLRAMKIPKADVAGWSMGGWVAMKLAADRPELVNRLVLYDSAGVYFPLDYAPSLFTPTDAAGLDALMKRLTPKRVTLPGFVARDFLRRSAINAWVIERSLLGMTSGRDLMEFRLHEIKAPTAVMWGMDDALIPPSAGKKIAQGIPDAVFLPITQADGGCGHLAPAECEAEVLPATVKFLQAGQPDAAR